MTRSHHRSADEWKTLIRQWEASGQSALQFCKSTGLGYASFCNWRKRLAEDSLAPSIEPTSFIDLRSLAAGPRGWDIVLHLGNGVELRLSQR